MTHCYAFIVAGQTRALVVTLFHDPFTRTRVWIFDTLVGLEGVDGSRFGFLVERDLVDVLGSCSTTGGTDFKDPHQDCIEGCVGVSLLVDVGGCGGCVA